MAVGVPISVIYILSRYIYLKNSHENTAREISEQLISDISSSQNSLITISNDVAKLIIDENDFLCVQSMENYCSFYYVEKNQLQKTVIRISLSNALQQTETQFIKKCHRSYIVNLKKVKHLKGNAQGYKLFLSEIDFEIPVSRSFISDIIPQLQSPKN